MTTENNNQSLNRKLRIRRNNYDKSILEEEIKKAREEGYRKGYTEGMSAYLHGHLYTPHSGYPVFYEYHFVLHDPNLVGYGSIVIDIHINIHSTFIKSKKGLHRVFTYSVPLPSSEIMRGSPLHPGVFAVVSLLELVKEGILAYIDAPSFLVELLRYLSDSHVFRQWFPQIDLWKSKDMFADVLGFNPKDFYGR